MTCTCPKCHAKIELDLPEVTEADASAVCTACNARFSLHRESFGGRALHKASEISCALCGSELGSGTHCESCGAQFPDFLVAGLGRKRGRKDSKKLKLKTSPFPKKQAALHQLPSLEMSMRPEGAAHAPVTKAAGSKWSKTSIIATSALVAVALIGAGLFFYLRNEARTTYAKNFVMATFCVQSGIDRSLKADARLASEWKAKADGGQPYAARPTMDDERDFGIINSKLESVLPKLSQPPKNFESCNDRLNKLQTVYNKMRSQVMAPGNSLQAFTDSTNKLEAEYKQAVADFKSGMPTEIMDELVSASARFKGLRPLLH